MSDLDKKETKRYNNETQCSDLDWILDSKKSFYYTLWNALFPFLSVRMGMWCVRDALFLGGACRSVQGRRHAACDPFLVGQSHCLHHRVAQGKGSGYWVSEIEKE